MIGRLRHQVQVQAQVEGRNSYGESVLSWITAATVPAFVLEQGGGELPRAGQVQSERTYLVSMRAWPGLESRHRLAWGERTLEIESVRDPDGRGVWVEVQCRSR